MVYGLRMMCRVSAALVLSAGLASAQAIAPADWPQLGRDAQRTNASPLQVAPPYCYAWKWYEVPIAGRVQPVVAAGRLFVPSLDGALYARDASTGAPLWRALTGGPLRHAAGVAGSSVIVSSHDGQTYAFAVATGTLTWKVPTGASATAPLIDTVRNRVYVAATDGGLTALELATGAIAWRVLLGAPILTTPSLSADGTTIYVGTEAVQALAIDAANGSERWRTSLPGQSLADTYPVVTPTRVFFRSQPIDHFHPLLRDGDGVMDRAGPLAADWATDWTGVRGAILSYLTAEPTKQTFHILDPLSGASAGMAPVLYTYGNNDIPAPPAVRGSEVYVPYRARHGIQNDSSVAVHVTTKYDAELGRLGADLDITGLRQRNAPAFAYEFRLTSDEPGNLTVGGSLLYVDNWERLGAISLDGGDLYHLSAVSNDWPECYSGGSCGPVSATTFFPLTAGTPAYPFPSPRASEGKVRPGAVVANDRVYWRVIEGGLAAFAHRGGTSCAAPQVWAGASGTPLAPTGVRISDGVVPSRAFADYVSLDLTAPAANPPADLVARLRGEIRALVDAGGHLMPYYLQRGFSNPNVWPNTTTKPETPPKISYNGDGNVYWHDPGELLLSVAMAYPYLDAPLQADLRAYMAGAFQRYPPLSNMPWSNQPWLKTGVARERYAVPFRASINNWPPPGASLQAIYALWLWSKATGDWSYAQARWADAKTLFAARRTSMTYYADIAGAIGYARLATQLGDTAAAAEGAAAAASAMQAGLDFDAFVTRAEREYLDARDQQTGWYLPAFFGLTPEVGMYLREHLGDRARGLIADKQTGDGLRWWYLTRAGTHAEVGETSFVAPNAAWSHFLAQAYILGAPQGTLRQWLDRPWARGDLFSIQRLVATLQAR
jgi:hypothetical protein